MRNIKIILFIIILSSGLTCRHMAAAQDIRIGLFESRLVSTFIIHCIKGQYNVLSPEKLIVRLQTGNLLYISLIGDGLSLHDGNMNYGSYKHIHFNDLYKDGEFRIKIIEPGEDPRNYQGNLEVKVHNSSIQLINQLSLDNYLAGVIETEGGTEAPQEYYKAQAVISRTFALKHWNKHENQHFNLCDDLHCQAYKGISDENHMIFESVLATHNLVLYSRNYKLITTPFHSNSGGETQRASDIWIAGEEYLQAVLDPFSKGQRNSEWSVTLPLSYWREYIFSQLTSDTSEITNEFLLIRQPHRKKHFNIGKDTLLLANIRKEMGFRSTFFDTVIKGDSILFSGKGYGHGVGLSQEGAMEMARQGYSFFDILRFYYDNIEISDLSDLPKSELPEPFR